MTPGTEPYLVHLSRKAMAGEFEVCLPVAIAGDATATALEALDLVQALEAQLSFFRPDSDISEINRHAADAAVQVEPQLFALLQWALQLGRETGGAYDLTAAPLWEAWGFARRAGAIPSPEQLSEAKAKVGLEWIELDANRMTIRFLRPGVKLNLGSIGKGYAVDRAVAHLASAGVSDFLVHGGYSSVAARGWAAGPAEKGFEMRDQGSGMSDSVPPILHPSSFIPHPSSPHPSSLIPHPSSLIPHPSSPHVPWTVGIKDPLRDDRRLGQIELRDRALGTSGSQFQSFRHQGHRYGHILDPRTGWPAEGVLAVSVLAPTAAEADALSTAFYVLGPEAALNYCRQRPSIVSAIADSIAALVFASAPGNRWVPHHAGLAEESADLLAALMKSGSAS
jgi:FAD:protein FMN transferase